MFDGLTRARLRKISAMAEKYRNSHTMDVRTARLLAEYAIIRFEEVQNEKDWSKRQYLGLNKLDSKRMIKSDGGEALVEVPGNEAPVLPEGIKRPRKDHPEEFPMRVATPDECREAKLIMWLGVDQAGRGYAHESLYDFMPLLEGLSDERPIPGIVIPMYESNSKQRNELIEQSIEKPDVVTNYARNLVKKYFIPRLLDENGNFKEDPTKDVEALFSILTHSYGGIVSKAFGNAIKELFTATDIETLQKYGLEEPLPYDNKIKDKIYRSMMQTVSIGFPLVIHKPEDFHPPYVNRLNILYEADMGPHQPDFIRGLHHKLADSKQPYHIILDPNDSSRTMIWIKTGNIENQVGKKINVLGHARSCYASSLTDENSPLYEIGKIAKRMLSSGKIVNLAEEFKADKFKDKIINESLSTLEQWTKEADKKGNVEQLINYMEQLNDERLLWAKTKPGQHPLMQEKTRIR